MDNDDITAKVSSRGQVTIPKPIRDALDISGGEEVVFRQDWRRILLATEGEALDRAETVVVAPQPVRPRVPWDAARRSLLSARAKPLQPGEPIPALAGPEITVDLRAVEDAEVGDT